MGDRSRQKKVIVDNISYRESLAKVTEIEEEVKEIEAEIGKVEGQSEAEEGFEISENRIKELNNKKHRLDGKVGALTEQAQHLKGKLNSSTYKGVDEKVRRGGRGAGERALQHFYFIANPPPKVPAVHDLLRDHENCRL